MRTLNLWKKCTVALLTITALSLTACSSNSDKKSKPVPLKSSAQASYLLVLWANKSTITANPDQKSYQLTLHNINPQLMAFSDRPNRKGTFYDLATFINNWTTGGDSFATNPPNAGLVALPLKTAGTQTNIMVTLSNPIYNARKGTLTFTITSIDPTQSIPLGPLRETILFMDSIIGSGSII